MKILLLMLIPDQITRLKTGNQYVVSLSTANEEVIVWSVEKFKPVRTLRGVDNPNGMKNETIPNKKQYFMNSLIWKSFSDLKIIDNTRVVILCGRELQIFNLDDVCFVSKMKGVMNQKMPFFGLHDENHIVSL